MIVKGINMPVKHEVLTKNGKEMRDLTKKIALRLRCLNCSGWGYKEVKECKFTDCKIYPYREGDNPNSGVQRMKDLRDYCKWCSVEGGEPKRCQDFNCPLWPFRKGSATDKSREGVSTPTDLF